MAEQQGVGGGEQLPAAVIDNPSDNKQEVVAAAEHQVIGEGEQLPAAVVDILPDNKQEVVAAAEQQIVGGGEQLPAAVVDIPPDNKQEVVAAVEIQPEVPVSINTVGDVPNQNNKVNIDVAQVLPEKREDPPILPSQPEVALDDVKEIKADTTSEPNLSTESEQPKEQTINVSAVPAPVPETNVIDKKSDTLKESGDWQKRESELLKKIEELEMVKNERSEDGLRLELKVREEEIDLLKARVKNLETELQAALSKPGGKNHEMIENIKQQHEELLSKARGMIFDKTKMVKNQELQIEALSTQVQSLKDINVITKDLLEIRNSEVKAMEDRFQAMEARYKAEKERYELVLKRAQTSTTINDDLRKEYETQLAIFKELREKYEQRVQALVAENNRFKEALKGPGPSG